MINTKKTMFLLAMLGVSATASCLPSESAKAVQKAPTVPAGSIVLVEDDLGHNEAARVLGQKYYLGVVVPDKDKLNLIKVHPIYPVPKNHDFTKNGAFVLNSEGNSPATRIAQIDPSMWGQEDKFKFMQKISKRAKGHADLKNWGPFSGANISKLIIKQKEMLGALFEMIQEERHTIEELERQRRSDEKRQRRDDLARQRLEKRQRDLERKQKLEQTEQDKEISAAKTREAEARKKAKTSNWLSSPWALAAYLGLAAAAVLNVDYLTSLFYTTPVQRSPASNFLKAWWTIEGGVCKVIKLGIPTAIAALLGYKTYRRYKGAKSTEQGSPTEPNEEGLTPEEVEERHAESSGEKRIFGLKRNHIIIGGIILVCIALFALLFMCDGEEDPDESKDDNGDDAPQAADGWDAEPEDLL